MKALKFFLILTTIILLLTSCTITKKTDLNNTVPESTEVTSENNPLENADPIAEQEKNAPDVEESVNKIGSKIIAEPAYKACVERTVQTCGSELISKFAREKDSDDICNEFDDETLKATCKNAINTQLALKKLDNSYCEKLDNANKSSCESQVIMSKAVADKDTQVCEGLKTTNSVSENKDNPQALVINNNDQRNQCIQQVISQLPADYKTLLLCKNIDEKMQLDNCSSMVKSRIEMEKNMQKQAPEIK